ncbi:hypothetical protein F2Q69_00030532 [Brassica cretica]|uniref:Uncharacterized protein n=1 Tax=Brassica cretica TaxID=69181 RepID=A0A8S9RSS1_BRACR|nr:hypothetical protein F2Q69_00030532 [Brassica cretica]
MAFSASSSPVSVSGRRWLFQHRDRRLLFPGGGGSLSIASAGWRLLPSDKFVDPASYDSRSDDDVTVSHRIVDFGAEGRRKQGSRSARIERRLTC